MNKSCEYTAHSTPHLFVWDHILFNVRSYSSQSSFTTNLNDEFWYTLYNFILINYCLPWTVIVNILLNPGPILLKAWQRKDPLSLGPASKISKDPFSNTCILALLIMVWNASGAPWLPEKKSYVPKSAEKDNIINVTFPPT